MMYARQADSYAYYAARASAAESYRSAAAAAAAAQATGNAQDQDEDGDGFPDQFPNAASTTAVVDDDATTTSGIGLEASTTEVLLTNTATATATATDSDASTTGSTTDDSTWPAMQTKGPPSLHSYAPTTLTTTTNSGAASITDFPNTNPNLRLKEAAHKRPDTAVIAGVVVPIVVILFVGLGALLCYRRRRRQRASATDTTTPTPANVVEKASAKRLDTDGAPMTVNTNAASPLTHIPPQLPQLVLSSPQNPTYFTGLDTFSLHSAATTEDPPPPYRAQSILSNRSSEQNHRGVIQPVPLSPVSPITPTSPTSPTLTTPTSYLQPEVSPFGDAQAAPFTRSPSTRSFASTLYSSNASVYEARPERMSSGNAAEYVLRHGEGGVSGGSGRSQRLRSPFEDPEDPEDES